MEAEIEKHREQRKGRRHTDRLAYRQRQKQREYGFHSIGTYSTEHEKE